MIIISGSVIAFAIGIPETMLGAIMLADIKADSAKVVKYMTKLWDRMACIKNVYDPWKKCECGC